MPGTVVEILHVTLTACERLSELNRSFVHSVPESDGLRSSHEVDVGAAHSKFIAFERAQIHPACLRVRVDCVLVPNHLANTPERDRHLFEVLRREQLIEKIEVRNHAPHCRFGIGRVYGRSGYLKMVATLWS